MTLQGPMKPKEHRTGLASQRPPDWSSWPWHVGSIFSSATEPLGLAAFLPVEKNCPSPPGTRGQNSEFTTIFRTIQGLFT